MTKEELQKEFKATHIPQLGENFWFAYATWLEEQVIKYKSKLMNIGTRCSSIADDALMEK